MSSHILIVDDENDIRSLIKGILEDEGYVTSEAANAIQALNAVKNDSPDLVILDIWLQNSDKDGLEILKTIKADNPILPVLMISGHGTIETAVSAIKQGAYDFIEKPFKSDRLLVMVARALEAAALKQENMALKERGKISGEELIGNSAVIEQLRLQIGRVAPTNSRVLISGEGGTGKEVVAKLIHLSSPRKEFPFMVVNCAALHPERLEEELFGSLDKGAIRKGLLELSNGGTLLLDEVADMPLETQGKILRFLQDNKIHPVGSQRMTEVNVRIIASTNRDLQEAIRNGNFREDLYYRLNVVTLYIPPLKTRMEDIAPLARYFLGKFSQQTNQSPRKLSHKAQIILESYRWPGNVRQLRNVMEWLTIMLPHLPNESEIAAEDLPPEINGENARQNGASDSSIMDYVSRPLREARESFERQYLLAQIKRFKGNISQTADFIGMERSALHRKLKSLEISSTDEQDSDAVLQQPEKKTA